MTTPEIQYLAPIHFKNGAVHLTGQLLEESGIRHPMIVTDPGLESARFPEKLELDQAQVFSRIDANPSRRNVIEGLDAYRDSGCDGIVALGGGSPIDAAKAIALLASQGGELEDYAFIRGDWSSSNHEGSLLSQSPQRPERAVKSDARPSSPSKVMTNSPS